MKIFHRFSLLFWGLFVYLLTLECTSAVSLRRRRGWQDATSEFIFMNANAWDPRHGQTMSSPAYRHRGRGKTRKRSASVTLQQWQGTRW
ncbi:uncharacterized protein LOC119165880 isoform X2 [Rhipicephalus microplus]|uniref:uncharacterized protein LOC119165880 isoform X2 n=1 Tax=Rhipicephalus microplus TaxID=6941 RepID=UPI003F6BE8DB